MVNAVDSAEPSLRRVKLQDIADAAGVSVAAVSLALNDRDGISAETRRRVVEVARDLNYERPAARARQSLATISVIIERLPVSIASDPFNRPILQ